MRRVFGWLAIAAMLAAGLMIYDAWRFRNALERIANTVQAIDLNVLDDPAVAHDTIVQLQNDTSIAARSVSGPLWAGASHLPQVGDDVTAVRIFTHTISDLTHQGLPELLYAATTMRAFTLGNADLNAVGNAVSQIQASDAALERGITQLQNIDQSDLVPEIGAPITAMILELQLIRSTTAPISAAGELVASANQIVSGFLS